VGRKNPATNTEEGGRTGEKPKISDPRFIRKREGKKTRKHRSGSLGVRGGEADIVNHQPTYSNTEKATYLQKKSQVKKEKKETKIEKKQKKKKKNKTK